MLQNDQCELTQFANELAVCKTLALSPEHCEGLR